MRGLLTDCSHALRLYRRTPGASVTAVIVLAIGVAFVGAFLALYVDLVLRPHPGFEQSNRIATVGQTSEQQALGMPFAVVERMTGEMTSIEAAVTVQSLNVFIGIDRETVGTELVSAGFFDGLRPRIALGRGLLPEEHRVDSEPVVVISHRLWQQRFGGDPNVVGTVIEVARDSSQPYLVRQSIRIGEREVESFGSGEPEQETTRFRIVGVMSASLRGLTQPETSLWMALERGFPLFIAAAEFTQQSTGKTFVRMRPGVSAAALASELDTRYANDMPSASQFLGLRIDAIEGVVQDIAVQRDAKRQLQIFLAGSVLLCLVAAANVSLFLLARAPGRRRELGIRMAVGAPLMRIARQLATEASLLVVAAAILGLALSGWLAGFLRGLALLRQAEWEEVTLLDWRVLALAAAMLLALTVLVSLVPALGVRRLGVAAASRETMARASLAQRLAGTAQIAVAGALGGAAVAFGWHMGALTFGDPGYEIADRYMVRFEDGGMRSGMSFEAYFVALARWRETIEAIPGIEAIAFGNPVPGAAQTQNLPARFPDPNDATQFIEAQLGMLDTRFVDVLGLRLADGRGPAADRVNTFGDSVTLVNQSFARAFWGREDVVGERLPQRAGNFWTGAEVVGVLEDLSYTHPAAEVEPYIFMTVHSNIANMAVIQTSMTQAQLQQELDALTASGALDLRAGEIRSLRSLRNEQLAADRARGFLTLVTASLVVFLAAFGYYGTQRYLVAAGRREYAIRSALGAGPRRLGRLVVQRGLLMSLPGLALGGMLGFIVVAWLRDDFVSRDISPSLVVVWVVVGLNALLFAATVGPALTASRTQPAPVLREE